MTQPLHNRAYVVAVGWTLVLLFLGSVVHATESSLACPDWPTCYGTMIPAMEGGIFWEHLHRLVAGGLLLLWGLATWLAWREGASGRTKGWTVAGLVLLLVQSVFGGLTVLLLLPDAISTTHLGLALLFLALAAGLAVATSPGRDPAAHGAVTRAALRRWGVAGAVLVFAQSVLGGVVRHMDAGMACPDVPLCLGRVIPPLANGLVGVHYAHRVLGIVAALVVVAAAVAVLRHDTTRAVRRLAWSAAALVLLQVGLGFASVWSILAVVPVSLHTLVAAGLLAVLTALAAHGWARPASRPTAAAATAAAA